MSVRASLGILAAALTTAACHSVAGPPASTEHRYVEISAGVSHTCAVGLDGLSYCWGSGSHYQLGSLAVRPCVEGTCPYPMPVEGGSFTAVAAGASHSCGISGRRLVCWGRNQHGQLGDGGLVKTPCSALQSSPGVPPEPCSPAPFLAALGYAVGVLTSSWDHGCAIIVLHRTLYCWGANGDGRLGVEPAPRWSTPRLIDIGAQVANASAGAMHTCATDDDGRAYCWGEGGDGRLGTGTADEEIFGPQAVAGEHAFRQVSAGYAHTCGVTFDGDVLCWGRGADGRLGTGDEEVRWTPAPVALPGPATSVSAGGAHTCAILGSGALWCWGRNAEGQLGDGSLLPALIPVPVPLEGGARHVDAGLEHTCALDMEGFAWCWGANGFGQLGTGTYEREFTPARVGIP